ncbi:hypothetical protein MPSEU_000402800 [Mayamaea pseudoterrestris]|nr:hypothetical protein MPSEU_000402800 [Mayamaea pseudoterrestris]
MRLFFCFFVTTICCERMATAFTATPIQRQSSRPLQTATILNHNKFALQTQRPKLPSLKSSPSMSAERSNVDTTIHHSLPHYPRWKAALVRTGMVLYICCMCIALPVTLLPLKYIGRVVPTTKWPHAKRQRLALLTGQFCARQLLKIIPFCRIDTKAVCATGATIYQENPVPTIWVCNHTSMLDVFLLLAADKRLRGLNRRPIQIVYWKDLEKNPVTRLLFRQAGFIAVSMADNGNGTNNEYDKSSFKTLLKQCKQSIANGFDIGLLPEGQLNPTPELGLLPIFGGAQFLAKMAKRPIQFMAMHGAHHLWHSDPVIGMRVSGRNVVAHTYWPGRFYASAVEFSEAFTSVVGEFGKSGLDLPQHELDEWLLPSHKSDAVNGDASPTSSTEDNVKLQTP